MRVIIGEMLVGDVAPEVRNRKAVVDILDPVVREYGIDTSPQAICCFMAQIAHESGGFQFREEGLNYSAERLMQIFKRHFVSIDQAKQYARKPEMIANRVYANRMDNGPESSGDGWRYRGRGWIQITGKFNYSAYAAYKGMTLDQAVAFLSTREGAGDSAGWFWKYGSGTDLTRLADGIPASEIDANDPAFVSVTRKINGGTNGLGDRILRYNRAIRSYR